MYILTISSPLLQASILKYGKFFAVQVSYENTVWTAHTPQMCTVTDTEIIKGFCVSHILVVI